MQTFLVGYKGDCDTNSWLFSMGFEIVNQSDDFVLWSRLVDDFNPELHTEFKEKGYHRIFEKCFVVRPSKSEHRQEVIYLLFSEISGDTYKATIDLERNIGCYDALFEGAIELCTSINRILDFGCGPGTILASKKYHDVETLIGFDFIPENRQRAREIGLDVFEVDQLDKIEFEYFDLVVCSYVLHYRSVKIEMIDRVFDSLRIGGVWAANFHKSEGVSWFMESLPKKYNIEVEIVPSQFGDLMYARKVSRA